MPDDDFPTLDELFQREAQFTFCETSSLKQRHTDIARQPRLNSALMPVPLFLLSKKVKRCKTCTTQIIKPVIATDAKEAPKINYLMWNSIVKVTIYRVGKVKPEQPFVDLFMQFTNPNISLAKIRFSELMPSQTDGKGLNSYIQIPTGKFIIDPVEHFISGN